MLYARDCKTNYENFEARCPTCGEWNIFNRATDFGDFSPISFREVTCLRKECGARFAINGDSADPGYAEFLFEVFNLREQKRYALCVVAIAQAYEMFFAHFLREQLALKLFDPTDHHSSVAELNRLLELIYSTSRKWAFQLMRNVFINVALMNEPQNLAEGETIVRQLSDLTTTPDDMTINACPHPETRALLQRLKGSKIAEVRNQVAHKNGYRPTFDEMNSLFDEARDLIWELAEIFDVRYDSL